MELKQRPCGIPDNFSCTLNSAIVPTNLARSDDNGAYFQKGCPKRLYYVWDSSCVTAHCEDGAYYFKKQSHTKHQKIYVGCKKVYELNRIYSQNKQNRAFIQMFATGRRVDQKNILWHYFMFYRWIDGVGKNEKRDFVMSRHRNAKRPHASTYYRQNPVLRQKSKDKLSSGVLIGKAYRDLVKQAGVK